MYFISLGWQLLLLKSGKLDGSYYLARSVPTTHDLWATIKVWILNSGVFFSHLLYVFFWTETKFKITDQITRIIKATTSYLQNLFIKIRSYIFLKVLAHQREGSAPYKAIKGWLDNTLEAPMSDSCASTAVHKYTGSSKSWMVRQDKYREKTHLPFRTPLFFKCRQLIFGILYRYYLETFEHRYCM